jgi:hypothetical protein
MSVDLEFDTMPLAEAFLTRMRVLWAGTGGEVSAHQRARILETVETAEY